MTSKIAVKNLNLSLGNDAAILHNVTLEITKGKVTSLIGPSGSGKSTLLRCFNRLWEPPQDSIFLEGEDITTLDVLSLRRRVGMLFQSAALFEGTIADLTPTHEMALMLELAGAESTARTALGSRKVEQIREIASGRIQVIVPLSSQVEADRVVDDLRQAKISILSMAWRRKTLEDAFLELVARKADTV